jgi:hypothetical protein
MATARPPARLLDDGFLSFLPTPLREPRRPWLVLPLSFVLTLFGAAAIALLVSLIAPAAGQPDFSQFLGKGMLTVFVLAVVTPFIETLILAVTCSVMLRFVRAEIAILLSSFGWAIAHSYQAPMWGLVIFWPFVVFSTLYVVWKQRSLLWGIMMPFLAHLLHNLYSAISLGFPGAVPSV